MKKMAMAVAGLLVASALAGCAPVGAAGFQTAADVLGAAKAANLVTQSDALMDLQVTRDELESAFAAYAECAGAEDVEVTRNGTNPVDGWRPLYEVDYSKRDDAAAVDNRCSDAHYRLVMFGYELTNEPVMDEKLMADLQDCLGQMGVETQGDETNLPQLAPLGAEDPNKTRIEGCLLRLAGDQPNGMMWGF
ncbi:MAG: hypothetical protein J7480_01540 [Microbacteriaceae bacterium]|nr:hypothetical protein [Microbacteriaceae bacterium]